MERFLTRRYVAVTPQAAQRLARLDGTPEAGIRHTPEVVLLHRTQWWAWWSDDRLTTAIGLPEALTPAELSPDAVALIALVWEGAAAAPRCGWRTLAQVAEIVAREPLAVGPGDAEAWVSTTLTVRFRSGDLGMLYCYCQILDGDYWCDISVTPVDDSAGS